MFQEEGAAGASDSGAQEPRTSEGIPTSDVGIYVDTLVEEPAAAERKRRRTAVPGQSSGAVEAGRNASKAAPKRKGEVVHPPAEAGGEVGSAAGVGRPPEGRKSHTSSSNVAVVDSAAGVGRPPEGRKSHTSSSNVAVVDSAAGVGRPPEGLWL